MGRIRINRTILLFLALLLVGCASGKGGADAGKPGEESRDRETGEAQGNGEDGVEEEEENVIGSMETEPDLVYEVPASVPNICVNQLGYITKGDKTALFYGGELPKEFQVVKEESGEVVFTGTLRNKGYNTEQQEYNGYGDFSEVQESGVYYIEAPVLGRSYSFMIGDDLYRDVFEESCRQYERRRCGMESAKGPGEGQAHETCHTQKAVLREDPSVSVEVNGGWHREGSDARLVTEAAREIAVTLLSYELNTDIFTDDTGIPESGNGIPDFLDEARYEAEWMLKMQEAETGAVHAGVTVESQGDGGGQILYVEPASGETEEAFAMALAKFSYLYQGYDTDFATDCLKAADRAWMHADLTGEGKANAGASGKERDAWKFAAAAELYRASGKQSYHAYVSEYLSGGIDCGQMDLPVLSGCVTYISTRGTVELALCQEITEALTARAEEAAQRVEDIFFGGRQEGGVDESCRELLEESIYLIVINHMITSKEYAVAIENCLHYLMGRNAQSVSYIDHVGEDNYQMKEEDMGASRQPEENSRLILLLSDIRGWQMKHGDEAE